MSLEIVVRVPGHVGVAGECDLTTSEALREALMREAKEHDVVVLDLSELTFADCATMHVLFDVASATSLRLVGAREIVAKVIDITGVARHPGIELE